MVRTVLLLVLSLLLPACGTGTADTAGPPGPDPGAFKPEVEHGYFPLERGRSWVYEGDDEGRFRRELVRALDEPRVILGIPCTALLQEITLDGEVAEITTEWYAEDRDGNVWKFGEESLAFEAGTFYRTEDSWMAGEDGATLWMVLAAIPRVGDVYAGTRPDGHDEVHVLSLSETVAVPAGKFEGCLLVEETTEDVEDADVVLYAEATGKVAEQGQGGSVALVEESLPNR